MAGYAFHFIGSGGARRLAAPPGNLSSEIPGGIASPSRRIGGRPGSFRNCRMFGKAVHQVGPASAQHRTGRSSFAWARARYDLRRFARTNRGAAGPCDGHATVPHIHGGAGRTEPSQNARPPRPPKERDGSVPGTRATIVTGRGIATPPVVLCCIAPMGPDRRCAVPVRDVAVESITERESAEGLDHPPNRGRE